MSDRPLTGTVIVDLSRMLPGATLDRALLDFGARVIKVEDPAGGDAMRHVPPLVDDTGAGFGYLLAGAESVAIDLKTPEGSAAVRKLARHADVLVESFRPGTMDRLGLGPDRLQAANPTLIRCSLTGFRADDPDANLPGHDINFAARSGMLARLCPDRVPGVQVMDTTAGVQAALAICAALFQRTRTGQGAFVEVPLADAAIPHLAWAYADHDAGGGGMGDTVLAGRCPSYRMYECADGSRIAVAALEPKFWTSLVNLLGIDGIDGAGLDTGAEGEAAAKRIAEVIATQPRNHWLTEAHKLSLPITAVYDIGDAPKDGVDQDPRPAPGLGEHTDGVLREFGVSR